MKELNYRFKSIEEKIIQGVEVHRAMDSFEDCELFIEKYKEVNDMDWEASSTLDEELESLKSGKDIEDYFYANDYDRDVKIYYKVFREYHGFDVAQSVEKTVENFVDNSKSDLSDHSESDLENGLKSDLERETEDHLKKEQEDISHTEKTDDLESHFDEESPAFDVQRLEQEALQQKIQPKKEKTYTLQELGGTVKVHIEESKDIFTEQIFELDPKLQSDSKDKSEDKSKDLLKQEIQSTKALQLDFNKQEESKQFMKKMVCKSCEKPVPKDKIDWQKKMAYCYHCKETRPVKDLSFDEIIKRDIGKLAPKGMHVVSNKQRLHIESKLNRVSGFIAIAISLIMLAFSSTIPFHDPLFSIIFQFIAPGFFFYRGLINLLNQVNIDVNKGYILIKSEPLPHFFAKQIASKDISQLYVEEKEQKDSHNKVTSYYFELKVLTKKGQRIKLMRFDDAEYALYIETVVESWLGIEDKRVVGDYK